MKIAELIYQLKKFSPDKEILLVDTWGDEHDFEMCQDSHDSELILIHEV